MSRGYSRLRQWLIMLFRMLVIAGLVVAVSRPLASGWIGLVGGGRADTTIVLLDRSPSMQQRSAGGGESKLETARRQLAQILGTVGSNRWVLIDSTAREPQELESPAALVNLPTAGPVSAPADLPLMLQAAHDYIRDERTGRTDIWICSDLRGNDWTADSGRWEALREAFLRFPQGVRFHLLAYPQPAERNVAVRVTSTRRQATQDGAELLVSVRLTRTGDEENRQVPLQFEIEGGRSVVTIEMTGSETLVRDHRIPIEAARERGFGRVSIPADANAGDNEFFFVFDELPPRRTLVVVDEQQAGVPLQLAAGIAPDEAIECVAENVTVDQLPAAAWDQVSLVLWQGPLPTGSDAELLESFVDRGGHIAFFPPRQPGSAKIFGHGWKSWSDEPAAIESWRGDADLLARTQSGAALPVGQLEIRRHCGLTGDFTSLATLNGGAPLLARAPTDRGGVYFWTTTPALHDSTLATNGIVLYASIQRALAAGNSVLGRTRSLEAGSPASDDASTWKRVSGSTDGLSIEAAFHGGVYAAGDRLLAVNRPWPEDEAKVLSDAAVAELFRGLDFTRVDDRAGSASSLIQEVWRIFLAVMLAALVLEALLCLPKAVRSAPAGALSAPPTPLASGRAA
jgi:hypothetical protein